MNLYLRKDGRFESRIPNGKKPDGKRAFLYVLARTKEHFLKYIKYSCVIFMQSDEKSVCAICIPDLISASLNYYFGNNWSIDFTTTIPMCPRNNS